MIPATGSGTERLERGDSPIAVPVLPDDFFSFPTLLAAAFFPSADADAPFFPPIARTGTEAPRCAPRGATGAARSARAPERTRRETEPLDAEPAVTSKLGRSDTPPLSMPSLVSFSGERTAAVVNIRQCPVDGLTNSRFSSSKRQYCSGIVNRHENAARNIDYRSVFDARGMRKVDRQRGTQLFEPATGMESYSTFCVHSARCAWRPSKIHETLAMHPSAYLNLYKQETSYDRSNLWWVFLYASIHAARRPSPRD